MSIEVIARYEWSGEFHRDQSAYGAVGRESDFSGCGFGERDLGWYCQSEWEAQKMKRALNKIGLRAEIRMDGRAQG